MSGPYVKGLGKRKRNSSESSATTTRDENEDFFFFEESCEPKRRRITQTDAEVIPKFRPDEKTSNVVNWLHKIDQLGDVYGWSSRERQFVMQIRLRGSAREWYDDLEDYDLSWADWKQALRTAFPRSTDFVDRLEEMLSRTKSDSETMTKYFHTKMSLLKKCKIEGEDAISCVIRGLPLEIRANAKAFKCDTPQELYFGYLSSLENYKSVEAAMKRSTWRRGNVGATIGASNTTTSTTAGGSTTIRQPILPKICYSCRRPGHEARDCRSQRCENCSRVGHATSSCWFGSTSTQQQVPKKWDAEEKNSERRGTRTQMQDGRVLSNYNNTTHAMPLGPRHN